MMDTRRSHALGICILSLNALFAACAPQTNEPLVPAGYPAQAASPTTPGLGPTLQTPGAAAGIGPVAGQAAPSVTAPVTTAAAAATPAGAAPASAAPSAPGTTAPGADTGWCGVKQTLDTNCTVCHNEMKVAGAPMSLKTYADLQAPAVSDPSKRVYEMVKMRVHDKMRPMPPQTPLNADQLAGIDAWVAGGAAGGADPTCPNNVLPKEMMHEWPTNCDETYKIMIAPKDNPSVIPASSETHPQVSVTPPWGNEEIQAIAWHSLNDNVKVLHHWILYGPSGEFIFGWAPGKDWNEPLPDDVGVYMPGGTMRMDVHYNNVGGTQEEKDASGVEICALKKEHFRAKTATTTNALTSFLINIPGRATDYDVTATCTHTGQPFNLLSVSPHAHRLAHHMKFTVEKANGMTIVMHDKDFNFNEQTTYPLKPAVRVESGDKIITTCTYTNDTDRAVTFGENTSNEMCFNFALYEPMGAINCGGGGFGGF